MLPRETYGGKWWTAKDDGSSFDDTTGHSGKPGWIAVPEPLRATDSDLLTVDAGVVRLLSDAERRPGLAVAKLLEINVHAASLIAAGVTHDSVLMSTSEAAQRNLLDLRQSASEITWPLHLSSLNDMDELVMNDAAAGLAFYGAVWSAVRAIREAARSRKALVVAALAEGDAAAGVAAIEAISVPW